MDRFISSLIILCFIVASGVSSAQAKRSKELTVVPSNASQTALVRRSLEGTVQVILEKYLKPHQYAIDVSFKMPAELKAVGDVPYAPDSIIADSYQGTLSPDQLKKLEGLEVKVLVPQWMNPQTKATLQAMLSKRLDSVTGTSVRLEMQSVPLNVEEPPQAVPTLNSNQAATIESRGSAKEIDEVKVQMQKERDQFAQEMKEIQQKMASQEKSSAVLAGPAKSGFQEFWEFAKSNPIGAGIVISLIYAGIFLLAFLPSRSFTKGLSSLQSAYGNIAKSMKGMADSMGKTGSHAAHESFERPSVNAGTSSVSGSGGSGGGIVKSTQPSYPELMKFIDTLKNQHKEAYDSVVIELILSYLSQSHSNFKAVMTLEMLGQVHAKRIFEQLSSDQKDQIVQLINGTGSLTHDKAEVLYEVAESYQTRLLAMSWKSGSRVSLDDELQRMIAAVKIEDLPKLVRQLKGAESLRRILLYFDAPMINKVMHSFRRNADEKKLILSSLAAMPDALQSTHADGELKRIVQDFLERKREDRYLPYMAQYETILANCGEEMEDDLLAQITQSNPLAGRQLKQKVVTIGSFFSLDAPTRLDVLEPFSNYEVAVLLSSFPEEQRRSLILSNFEPGRRELVQEQFQMLGEENKFSLAEAQKSLKSRLRESLRAIRLASESEEGQQQEEAIQESAAEDKPSFAAA